MANWRETIEDKLAEIDLWAVKQVNDGIDHLSNTTDRVVSNLKDKTKSTIAGISKGAYDQVKNVGQKMKDITRSVWEKRPKT